MYELRFLNSEASILTSYEGTSFFIWNSNLIPVFPDGERQKVFSSLLCGYIKFFLCTVRLRSRNHIRILYYNIYGLCIDNWNIVRKFKVVLFCTRTWCFFKLSSITFLVILIHFSESNQQFIDTNIYGSSLVRAGRFKK